MLLRWTQPKLNTLYENEVLLLALSARTLCSRSPSRRSDDYRYWIMLSTIVLGANDSITQQPSASYLCVACTHDAYYSEYFRIEHQFLSFLTSSIWAPINPTQFNILFCTPHIFRLSCHLLGVFYVLCRLRSRNMTSYDFTPKRRWQVLSHLIDIVFVVYTAVVWKLRVFVQTRLH